MNWRGFGRNRSCLSPVTIPLLPGKTENNTDMTADIPSEIRTKYLFNTSSGRTLYTNIFGETVLRGKY